MMPAPTIASAATSEPFSFVPVVAQPLDELEVVPVSSGVAPLDDVELLPLEPELLLEPLAPELLDEEEEDEEDVEPLLEPPSVPASVPPPPLWQLTMIILSKLV